MGRTNRCCKKKWIALCVSNHGSHQGFEGTTNSNMMFWSTQFFSLVPIHNFLPGTGRLWTVTRESTWYKPRFFEIDPTVGVPSTFGFANFIFQDPERYAYLSGTEKLRSIDRNFTKSGSRTCLVQMIKWKLEFRKFVSGGKLSDFRNDQMEAALLLTPCAWNCGSWTWNRHDLFCAYNLSSEATHQKNTLVT